jgi:hypothetical protein
MKHLTHLLVLACVLAGPATAKKGPSDLADLVAEADVIVTGTVVGIVGPDDDQVARLAVTTTLKGEARASLQFKASPSWQCDTTSAKVGDRLLLFLRSHSGRLVVVGSGTGIMSLVDATRVELEGRNFMPPLGLPFAVAVRPDGRHFTVKAATLFAIISRCVAVADPGVAEPGSCRSPAGRTAFDIFRGWRRSPGGGEQVAPAWEAP